MASTQRWSVRTLRERIDSMLYERTALSQKPEETIAQELATLRDAQRMSPALVMRDPYILDFLGLRDTWQEGDLEAAIIREMESFLLELGAGFHSSPGRSAFRSTTRISTLTFCSTTASCGGWLRWS